MFDFRHPLQSFLQELGATVGHILFQEQGNLCLTVPARRNALDIIHQQIQGGGQGQGNTDDADGHQRGKGGPRQLAQGIEKNLQVTQQIIHR